MKRILVVEDNDLNRKLFCDVLVANGFSVEPVADGENALASAAQFVPNLIIMDIQLPNVSGLDLIEAAKADAKRLAEEAKEKLEEQIKRRAEMAERKIAQAEAQATADVKAAAVDLAAQAAEAVLSARLVGLKSDPLVDQAIGQMGAKLQ